MPRPWPWCGFRRIRPVVDDSKFLNGLIARKSFSWTRVFMQLEQIMPPKLHVVSISPALHPKTNTVEVHMTVAGTSRDAAVELVKRLEQSPSFRDARIEEESAAETAEGEHGHGAVPPDGDLRSAGRWRSADSPMRRRKPRSRKPEGGPR